MSMFNLKPEEKLIRARVQLTNSHPFFARLTMALKFIEKPEVGTMGVNKFGVCYYNPDFVDSLTPDQLKGVLAHEVMHCALDHLNRGEKKDHMKYNVAGDLVINDMLKQNNLSLPDKALLPNYRHEYELQLPDGSTHTIEKINKRTADSIYDEIVKVWKDNNKNGSGGQGNGQGQPQQGHDKHEYGGQDNNNPNHPDNKGVGNRNSDYWKNKVVESHMAGKMAGNTPAGMERVIDQITNPKMTWRQILQKFVRNRIPYDFTWRRPSKKTYSTGVYMPRTTKEGVVVTLLIDTSGSISQKDLSAIFGEMKGLVGQVRGLKLKIIYHDTQVYEGSTLNNPTLADVKKEFNNVKGGGGTSFHVAYKYIEDLKEDVDIVIHATDGYATFPKKFKIPLVVLLVGGSKDVKEVEQQCPYAKVTKVDDDE